MTKKDYEQIATILSEGRSILSDERFRAVIGLFCYRLKEVNDKFDPLRFNARCWDIKNL